MAKPSNYPVTALDKSDYLEASNFTFDFQRGGAVTLIGIKEGVSLVAGTFDVGKHAEAAKWIEQYNHDRYNMYFHGIRPVSARSQAFSGCQFHGMRSSMRLIL